ncbi:hypothetical protein ABVV53_15025 [Novosphingobium sp. RD2P27]|uniref:Uncharacterized protein n=1 Tax=Novosphingobium kalidii TaxID=3230299 RepID=A0ABV2D4G3_9SPHN
MLVEPARHCAMIEALRKGGARGPWLGLLREVLALAGPEAQFLRHSERPWSSATFSGARHTVVLAFEGVSAVAQGEAFIAALPDHEFTLRGSLVADATISSAAHSVLPSPRLLLEAELLVLDDH